MENARINSQKLLYLCIRAFSIITKNIELVTISLLTIVTVLLIELQYIFGLINTPAGTIYLGSVHYPPDYFYYLSQFIQGRQQWLSSTMLYTSEKLQPVYVGWQNVLTGKILLSLGFDVIIGYQIAVVVYLSLFLFISYLLVKKVFPDSPNIRILSFFFFVSSTSLFEIIKTPNGFDVSYIKFWYNLGIMQSRFGPTPHHLVAYTLGAVLLLQMIKYYKIKHGKLRTILVMGILGFLLSTISPVHWGMLVLTAAVSGCSFVLPSIHGINKVIKIIRTPDHLKKYPTASLFSPAFILLIFGLPGALYVKYVFSMAPYSYSQAWEASQQIHLNLWRLIAGSGLIIPLGLIGLIPVIKKLNTAKLVLIIYLALGAFFYFSGVPAKFTLTNVRFWPSTVYIVWAILASTAVFYLAEKIKKIKVLIFIIIIFIYIASILPAHYAYEKEVLTPKIGNAYYYLSKTVLQTYKQTELLTGKESIYLIQWPYNEPFTALTGRKSFYGFYLNTVDYWKKNPEYAFFLNTNDYWEKYPDLKNLYDEGKTTEQARNFFNKYKIDYVLAGSWNKNIKGLPFIKEIYFNNLLGIYQVIRN